MVGLATDDLANVVSRFVTFAETDEHARELQPDREVVRVVGDEVAVEPRRFWQPAHALEQSGQVERRIHEPGPKVEGRTEFPLGLVGTIEPVERDAEIVVRIEPASVECQCAAVFGHGLGEAALRLVQIAQTVVRGRRA